MSTARFKRALIQYAVRLMRTLLRRPKIKSVLRSVLARFPALHGRLQGLMYRATLAPHAKWTTGSQADGDLSPRTLRMYRELQRAFDKRDQ